MCKLLIAFFLLVFSLPIAVSAASGSNEGVAMVQVSKEHPFLFLERSDVPKILDRAHKNVWAKTILDRVRSSADQWLDKIPEFPPSTGRHDMVYVCPDCKLALRTSSPTQHECPRCKKVYSGLPYDAVLYKKDHGALRGAALNLGLASLLFNDTRYARKALDILLGYAGRYSQYPLLDVYGKQGRSAGHIYDQTLDEAIWITDMAWTYDLVLGAGVGTEEEHRKVEEKLLRPAAGVIKGNNAGMSNWQAIHNTGMMAVGLCLKDRDLVNYVLYNDPGGFCYQMKNSVMEDGAWLEGSWSYHYFTLGVLLKTAEAAYHSGIDLYQEPKLRLMFEAPLKVLMPDGRFPATHDADATPPYAALYELAVVRYGNREFEGILYGRNRTWLEALLYGVDNPRKSLLHRKSAILPGIGAAILQREDQSLALDFGPHGGGHGHLDKLSVNYYTGGQIFAPDLGRGWPYSLPIHREWYTKTLSHNTVTVDGMDQKACAGKLISHRFGGEYDVVTASADDCYPGVHLTRTTAMGEGWLLDVFDASSDTEHTYDWTWYARAEVATALSCNAAQLTGVAPGYTYLSKISRGDGSQDWHASWKLAGGAIHGLFRGAPSRQVYFCEAPDKPSTDTLHGIILRDRAKTARFVALFSDKPMTWGDLPSTLRKLIE